MKPRIAIPEPHSEKNDYVARAMPQYETAITRAGGEPVRISVQASPDEIAKIISTCDAVLLPGSPADVDPSKYNQRRQPKTAPPDPLRDTVDELLLQDAYNMRKPVLGVCYGLQSLNVYRTGTLEQQLQTDVNHEAGRNVLRAHRVNIEPGSRLAKLLADAPDTSLSCSPDFTALQMEVNSSHHQAAATVGDGLRVSARSTEDDVIEAIEGTAPGHFVLAVQWHPERMIDDDPAALALFRALVDEARRWKLVRGPGSARPTPSAARQSRTRGR
jgi:putative glutamine amidotransferase